MTNFVDFQFNWVYVVDGGFLKSHYVCKVSLAFSYSNIVESIP